MPAGPSIPTPWPWWPGKAALTLSPLSPAAVPISSQQSSKVPRCALPCQPSSISQGTAFLGKGNCSLSSSMSRAECLQSAPMQQQSWSCVSTSPPQACPKDKLGLLSIPHGDLKFREPSLITQSVCLDLLKEAPCPAAGHHFLLRSCVPPSALLEPREALPTSLRHSWGKVRSEPDRWCLE